MSAYGLSLADVVHEIQEPCSLQLNQENINGFITQRLNQMKSKCVSYLIQKEKFNSDQIRVEIFLNLRYSGTDSCMMCLSKTSGELSQLKASDFRESFIQKYLEEYGFNLDRDIYVDDIRIRGIASTISKETNLSVVKKREVGDKIKHTDVKFNIFIL